jgi:hypothetical protein
MGCAGAPTGAATTKRPGVSGDYRYGSVIAVERCEAGGAPQVRLVLTRSPLADCAETSWPNDFLWIELTHGKTDSLPRTFTLGGVGSPSFGCHTSPTSGRCNTLKGTLQLDELELGKHAGGLLDITLPDGKPSAGRFRTRWCRGIYEVELCAHSAQ